MKKETIIRNSSFGFIFQVVSIFFQFICRKIFLDYLSIELLGLSNTFSSILNTLSLAELGFQNAIVYSLYIPLNNNDTEEINKIMSIFQIVYRYVGFFIVISSLVCIPLIPLIVTDIAIEQYVYSIFLIQAGTTASSYFLAYKRTLFYADQKEYVTKAIDLLFNLAFSLLQIAAIILTRNIYLFLLVKLVQTIGSNIFIHCYCSKIYPYLRKTRVDLCLFKKIFSHVREIFFARVAGYIYSSTDNIVISAFISTISVGFIANYITIAQGVKSIIESCLHPLIPIIGRSINTIEGKKREYELFTLYTHLRFLIACIIVIPMFILMDEFISIWLSDEYIMTIAIPVLLSIELYVHLVHGSCPAFINGNGMFRYDKYIEIIGAVTNIVISIVLAKMIGLPGVLVGTVISQFIFWVGRSYIVYRYIFNDVGKKYFQYWARQFCYIIVFAIATCFCLIAHRNINIQNSLTKFVVSGLSCEIIIILVCMITLNNISDHKRLLLILKRGIVKK